MVGKEIVTVSFPTCDWQRYCDSALPYLSDCDRALPYLSDCDSALPSLSDCDSVLPFPTCQITPSQVMGDGDHSEDDEDEDEDLEWEGKVIAGGGKLEGEGNWLDEDDLMECGCSIP